MSNLSKKSGKRFPITALILLGLLLVCGIGAGALLLVNARLPVSLAAPAELSREQGALIAEAQHLKTRLGDEVWPGFAQSDIPLLSFTSTHAFLCGINNPPAEWQAVQTTGLGDITCYSHPWQNGQNFTVQIEDRWVSSMATREWGLIELRRELREQLPPVLSDLAVPLMVSEMLKPHRYLGAVVHESFHAYQATAARTFFDDAEQAYGDSRNYWKIDPQTNAAWKAETGALYQAVQSKDETEAARFARQFLELRDARRAQFFTGQPALARYEQRFEWLEGLAKYTELGVQRAACNAPDYHSVDAMQRVEGFNGYCAIKNLWQQELTQMKRQASTPGETRFYYTGWAQALLLDRLADGWKGQAMSGASLEDLLRAAVSR